MPGRFHSNDDVLIADAEFPEHGEQLIAAFFRVRERNAVRQQLAVRVNKRSFVVTLCNVNPNIVHGGSPLDL